MTVTIELSEEVESYLRRGAARHGVSVEQFTLQVLSHALSREERSADLAVMFNNWREEDRTSEAVEPDDELFHLIDEDRPSYRKLFPPELKGVTW